MPVEAGDNEITKPQRRSPLASSLPPSPPQATLDTLQGDIRRITAALELPRVAVMDDSEDYEADLLRAKKWGGWVWGLVALMGTIFTAGIAWQVLWGENATDAELKVATTQAIVAHNDGIDPATLDPVTHRPVGAHPELRKAVAANSRAIGDLTLQTTELVKSQALQQRRSRFQFHLGRWQAAIHEAERRGKSAPRKPRELQRLEDALLLGSE